MALEDIRRSIWHAFTALAKGETGEVARSRLKVLTNSIGRALGKESAEEILQVEDISQDSLSFSDYFTIIQPRLLEAGGAESACTPKVASEIEGISWMLCEGYYLKNSDVANISSSVNVDDVKKLWKIFNFLAKTCCEESVNNVTKLPIRVDKEEAYRTGSLIRQFVGYNPVDIPVFDPCPDDTGDKFSVDFVQFLVIVSSVAAEMPVEMFRLGVKCAEEEILGDVIKKGYLEKFGNHVTNWKKRWFRLTTKQLKYFTTDSERDLKGAIEVCSALKTESLPQRGSAKQFRFKLHTSGKSFELSATDLRSRNEWITAIQKAADFGGQECSFQKCELRERERLRKARRDKIAEEEFGKSKMMKALENRDKMLLKEHEERLKEKFLLEKREQELEAERQKRLEVEAKLAEEEAQLEEERRRLKELEEIRATLERLLDEERRAKQDEELVRQLQGRLLLEETEKREELERLKLEQEQLLEHERLEKAGLENERSQQTALLDEIQRELMRLQKERLQADQKYLEAEEKIKLAELERHKMEERLRLREMSTSRSLRAPRPVPNPDPFVTHRGKGAFVEADFCKLPSNDDAPTCENSADQNETSHAIQPSESGTCTFVEADSSNYPCTNATPACEKSGVQNETSDEIQTAESREDGNG